MELVRTSLATDIPTQLRELAQEIEDGKHPDCRAVVALMVREGESTPLSVWAWGKISTLAVIGACAKAVSRLSFNDLDD